MIGAGWQPENILHANYRPLLESPDGVPCAAGEAISRRETRTRRLWDEAAARAGAGCQPSSHEPVAAGQMR
jgi:hypothetical protein